MPSDLYFIMEYYVIIISFSPFPSLVPLPLSACEALALLPRHTILILDRVVCYVHGALRYSPPREAKKKEEEKSF